MKLLKKVLGSLLALSMAFSPIAMTVTSTPVFAAETSPADEPAPTIEVTKTQTSTQKKATMKSGVSTKKSVSTVKGTASNGGKVTYTRSSGHKCLSVSSTGTVYVAKGTKAGKYYIWVSFKSGGKTVKAKLVVKITTAGKISTYFSSYKA